jgi:peptide/nickel transport system ATP-binding protein
MALLRRLCDDRGAAVMLVTHDMGVIAETADRVAVLYAGRVIEIGSVEEITRAPKHPYTSGLMGSIPPLQGRVPRLTQIDGAMPRPDAIPAGCPFNPRCAKAGPRCMSDLPPLVEIAGTKAACWLYSGGVN